jgi:hypothetical protein
MEHQRAETSRAKLKTGGWRIDFFEDCAHNFDIRFASVIKILA